MALQTRRDERRNTERATGTGKPKRQRGRAKGGRQHTQQMTQTQMGREDTESREGIREKPPAPHTMTSSVARRGADNQMTATMEGEGTEGDNPGYNPTPEDLRLRDVYGDWVHVNPGTHLYNGISKNATWQAWWRDLAVMTSRRYDAPSGRVGRRFVGTLGDELRGVR